MSETTTTTASDDSTKAVESVIPASENGVKITDLVDRAVLLLTAGTADPNQRQALDERAFTALARNLTAKLDGEPTLVHHFEELPVYGMNGEESLRYTKQRAMLLIAVAEAFACKGKLTFRKYTYSGGRRQYRVHVWGAEGDVKRTMDVFKVLQTRVIKDGYAIEIPAEAKDKPAMQTKIRRNFFAEFAANTGSTLQAIVDAQAAKAKAEGTLSDRASAAEKAMGEWDAANAVTESEKVVNA